MGAPSPNPYAGYVAWRGLVPEAALAGGTAIAAHGRRLGAELG